jgi:hypothetical protein
VIREENDRIWLKAPVCISGIMRDELRTGDSIAEVIKSKRIWDRR